MSPNILQTHFLWLRRFTSEILSISRTFSHRMSAGHFPQKENKKREKIPALSNRTRKANREIKRKGANHCIIILERIIPTFLIFRKQFWVLLFEGVAAFKKSSAVPRFWEKSDRELTKKQCSRNCSTYNGPCHP